MSNIINASKIFTDKKMYNRFSLLDSLIKKHEAMICANPMRYFNEACGKCHIFHKEQRTEHKI